jgi:hypothetical protein
MALYTQNCQDATFVNCHLEVVSKPSKCVLWPSTLRIVKTQLLCPSENLTKVGVENIPKTTMEHELFGSKPRPRGSYLKAAEPYIELVQHGFEMENISQQVAVLHSCCFRTNQCTVNNERILNKLERDITKILLSAEKACKKAKGHAWSPLLANAGRTVIAAKWHLSNIITGQYQLTLWNRAEEII